MDRWIRFARPRRISRIDRPTTIRRLALACLIAASSLAAAACSGTPTGCDGAPSGSCLRVLFIGNSYTYVNNLPNTFADLARSVDRRVEVDAVAEGGATLADAAASEEVRTKLAARRWDVVVLQEQSEIPSIPQLVDAQMRPAAQALVGRIEAIGARPVLFMTWAHRDGWPANGLRDEATMQRAIEDGYDRIAGSLGVAVVPVGTAWSIARSVAPGIALWQDDGSHPTTAGTYLAACVFVVSLLSRSPVGSSYTDGLAEADARTLQAVASEILLGGG